MKKYESREFFSDWLSISSDLPHKYTKKRVKNLSVFYGKDPKPNYSKYQKQNPEIPGLVRRSSKYIKQFKKNQTAQKHIDYT